jgi:biopolymer transport protein ExbD
MVDLGFLLITFFIFTTTMSQPKTLHWILPKDSPNPNSAKESGALTLIPAGNNRLYYYEGMDPVKLQLASIQSLREIIRNKQSRTNPADLMLILKPTAECSYKNTIALFDEMAIDQVRRYALVDLRMDESKQLKILEKNK